MSHNNSSSRTPAQPRWRRTLLATLIVNAVIVAAHAEQETQLAPVSVREDAETATSPVKGYVVKRSTSATKTDTPLLETPQSITVITADQILDQGAMNLQDALTYAAGVRSDAYGLDSRTDSARIRGSTPDEYLDGLRQGFNYYTSTSRTDPFMLERVEVLRGPSAMLYGQGSTAGVINMVSKRPQATAQGEVGVKLGSYDLKQLQLDVTGPLTENGEWLYRIVALGKDAGTQVDYVEDERTLLAPSLTWQPNDQLSLTLLARYQKDRTGSTSQFFPWSGTVKTAPNGRFHSNRFIGDTDDRYDSDRTTAGWLLQYDLNENWTLRQNLRYTRNKVDYQSVYADFYTPNAPFVDPANRELARFAWASKPTVHMWTTDQHVEGLFKTGTLDHQILVGVDAARFEQSGTQGGGDPLPIDAYNPQYTNVSFALEDADDQTISHVGTYIQDQIKIDKNWIVVAGLRHDKASNEVEDPARSPTSHDSATSKRLGLVYAADIGLSPYISYSESFTPLAGFDAPQGGDRYEPLRGKQLEVGIKYQPPGQNLLLNLAVYDLREKNQQTSGLIPGYYIQVEETRNKGAELEARGTFGNFELITNYSYTDVDDMLEGLPENQASVWGKWNFSIAGLPGFSAGTGVRYMSSFNDGLAPTTPTQSLVDGMFAWENDHWRYAINANNLEDKTYYSTCLSRGDCWYGARRNIIGSATYRW
jgi:iron complex outermembrane receptor protein